MKKYLDRPFLWCTFLMSFYFIGSMIAQFGGDKLLETESFIIGNIFLAAIWIMRQNEKSEEE